MSFSIPRVEYGKTCDGGRARCGFAPYAVGMKGRDHLPFAAGSWGLTGMALGVSPWLVCATIPIALLGGLLPDADHPSSKLGRRLPGVSHLIRWSLGHRGPTHSLFFVSLLVFGVMAAMSALGTPVRWVHFTGASATGWVSVCGLSFLIGVLSHLLADAPNPQGVPLFWPLPVRVRFPLLRWKSGSWIEPVIAWGLCAWAVWRPVSEHFVR